MFLFQVEVRLDESLKQGFSELGIEQKKILYNYISKMGFKYVKLPDSLLYSFFIRKIRRNG